MHAAQCIMYCTLLVTLSPSSVSGVAVMTSLNSVHLVKSGCTGVAAQVGPTTTNVQHEKAFNIATLGCYSVHLP